LVEEIHEPSEAELVDIPHMGHLHQDKEEGTDTRHKMLQFGTSKHGHFRESLWNKFQK
jgi:hypothetical protein